MPFKWAYQKIISHSIAPTNIVGVVVVGGGGGVGECTNCHRERMAPKLPRQQVGKIHSISSQQPPQPQQRQTSLKAYWGKPPVVNRTDPSDDSSDDDNVPLAALLPSSPSLAQERRRLVRPTKKCKRDNDKTDQQHSKSNGPCSNSLGPNDDPTTTSTPTPTPTQSNDGVHTEQTTTSLTPTPTMLTAPIRSGGGTVLPPSRRRIVSDSSVDDQPSEEHDETVGMSSQSIWKLLQVRSTTGSRPWSRSSRAVPPCTNGIRWKSPKWVQLKTPSSTTSTNATNKVDDLAFCSDGGVLLAVAFASKQIAIYDWDTVRAADQQGRRRSAATATTPLRFDIPPILVFDIPYSVSRLVWNPERPDQLAVGFKVVGKTYLYELDRIVTWQQTRQHPRRTTWTHPTTPNDTVTRYPPPNTYTELSASSNASRCQGTVLALVFFNNWILMSVGHEVCGFRRSDAQMQWRYQPRRPKDGVTCIAPLYHQAQFLLATQSGKMIVLDADRKARTALSLHDQPLVVDEWQQHRSPYPARTSREDGCCISNLSVSAVVHGYRQWMYVTASGWVCRGELVLQKQMATPDLVSTQHDHPTKAENGSRGMVVGFVNRNNNNNNKSTGRKVSSPATDIRVVDTQVLYAPPKIAIYNAQGESIGEDPNTYSTPLEPMVSQFFDAGGAVVFSKVPKSSKYLGHHDKYMVDYQPKLVRDTTESLALILLPVNNTNNGPSRETTTIPVKEFPQSVVLHPSGEWMVMGTKQGRLTLMTSRAW